MVATDDVLIITGWVAGDAPVAADHVLQHLTNVPLAARRGELELRRIDPIDDLLRERQRVAVQSERIHRSSLARACESWWTSNRWISLTAIHSPWRSSAPVSILN